MADLKLFDSELKFMNIVWDNEPIGSMQLMRLCMEKLKWKKSTVFTMLKKMCDKGFTQNVHSTVTSVVPREAVQAVESARVIEENFAGSLPGFLVSFLGGKKLSAEETERLKQLIEEHREE